MAPQVVGQLFGVRLPNFNSNFKTTPNLQNIPKITKKKLQNGPKP